MLPRQSRREEKIMSITPDTPTRVDQFFTVAEGRLDRWRSLLQVARSWEASANQQDSEKANHASNALKQFQELLQWEDFFAYPGPVLLKTLSERIASGDASGTVRLGPSLSAALLTHSYRTNLNDWESDESPTNLGDRVPGRSEDGVRHRPYFEVLFVSPARPSVWTELADDLRRLRRQEAGFVYEPVVVS